MGDTIMLSHHHAHNRNFYLSGGIRNRKRHDSRKGEEHAATKVEWDAKVRRIRKLFLTLRLGVLAG